jgi:hypothetical protein
LQQEKTELQERIAANLSKIQGLEMKAYTLEEQQQQQQQQQQDNELPNVAEMVAAKDERIAQLEAQLAAVKNKAAATAKATNAGDNGGLVKRLQLALKNHKELLRVRDEEIGVLRKQLSGQDNDLLM